MTLEDVEKLEVTADEIEHISHKAFTDGSDSKVRGLEKHRNQADHLRQVCKELRERADY